MFAIQATLKTERVKPNLIVTTTNQWVLNHVPAGTTAGCCHGAGWDSRHAGPSRLLDTAVTELGHGRWPIGREHAIGGPAEQEQEQRDQSGLFPFDT